MPESRVTNRLDIAWRLDYVIATPYSASLVLVSEQGHEVWEHTDIVESKVDDSHLYRAASRTGGVDTLTDNLLSTRIRPLIVFEIDICLRGSSGAWSTVGPERPLKSRECEVGKGSEQ